MSARHTLLILSSATLLIGCATAQENPNYQFSSKYDPTGAPVQMAQTDSVTSTATLPASQPDGIVTTPVTAPDTQPVVYATTVPQTYPSESYSAESYPVETYPSETYPAQTYPAQTYPVVSETEQAFDASTMDGTPGYVAMMAQQSEAVAPASVSPAQITAQPSTGPVQLHGPKPVAYDYSDNIVVMDTTAASAPVAVNVATPQAGRFYTVKADDTVYSLARANCVGLDAITTPNGIGADFAIKIGQTIQLPASRC